MRTHPRIVATGLAVLATSWGAIGPATAADNTTVPVLGQVQAGYGSSGTTPQGVVTVHGVRRIPGGTAVYFSIGFPAGTPNAGAFNLATILATSSTDMSPDRSGANALGEAGLMDSAGKKMYVTLMTPDKACVCSQASLVSHVSEDNAGKAYALYYVVPTLPSSVTTVDVNIAGTIIPDIPVEDGAMTPTLPAGNPIVVGTGWPAVDEAALAKVTNTGQSILPLTQAVGDLSGQITDRTKSDSKSVDIAADVLFAVDSAELSPAANATLAKAAAALKADHVTGTVNVIGYTDSDNTEAHNLDLSKRRAQAVVAALQPMVPPGVKLIPQGMGEADPVASNDFPEGKALNRRVSLSFANPGGAQ
ncbi:OmpA family protein [Branchiibius hedensis]|uniref:OmpA family protein n=1 Tax=Branchiibius hedensis TaxID=672460 RepID=A0A2Y8ZS85_9MICO|nr:OmpA family protein [Branchiibius hedensis]PWJ26419.1 OmpA family protein [Branchiibius hedensis]SSA35231.1 OmpA family protein [Branchiibius hedensis]